MGPTIEQAIIVRLVELNRGRVRPGIFMEECRRESFGLPRRKNGSQAIQHHRVARVERGEDEGRTEIADDRAAERHITPTWWKRAPGGNGEAGLRDHAPASRCPMPRSEAATRGHALSTKGNVLVPVVYAHAPQRMDCGSPIPVLPRSSRAETNETPLRPPCIELFL